MSYIIVHLVTASVVWRSAALLPQLGTPPQLHKPELMHGLRALAVVFVQIGTMHWFMSAVTMMSAAIIWPPLIRVFSSLVAGVCIMRYAHACTTCIHTAYTRRLSLDLQFYPQLQPGEAVLVVLRCDANRVGSVQFLTVHAIMTCMCMPLCVHAVCSRCRDRDACCTFQSASPFT